MRFGAQPGTEAPVYLVTAYAPIPRVGPPIF